MTGRRVEGGAGDDVAAWRVRPFSGRWLAVALLAACGAPHGSTQPGFEWGEAGTPGGDSGALGPGGGQGRKDAMPDHGVMRLGQDATEPMVDCPPSAKLIYVTGVGNDLYSFDPGAGKFTRIGTLDCLSSPTHMTVDRHGVAWVVSAGDIYKASTTDAQCSRVTTWTADPVHFPDFALTFLGTTSATDDSLYLLSATGELGVFDVATGQVTNAGTVTLTPPNGDMTTNGDGTLYFLIQEASQTLNELDPQNAQVIKSWSTGEDSDNSQALAYYGGVFYDFIGSAVYTYDTGTGLAKSIGTAPLEVTGAGQSTCVPVDAGPPSFLR